MVDTFTAQTSLVSPIKDTPFPRGVAEPRISFAEDKRGRLTTVVELDECVLSVATRFGRNVAVFIAHGDRPRALAKSPYSADVEDALRKWVVTVHEYASNRLDALEKVSEAVRRAISVGKGSIETEYVAAEITIPLPALPDGAAWPLGGAEPDAQLHDDEQTVSYFIDGALVGTASPDSTTIKHQSRWRPEQRPQLREWMSAQRPRSVAIESLVGEFNGKLVKHLVL